MTSRPPELEILRRGVVDFIEEEDLVRKMARGPLTVKVGFDPSAPDIHLGHTVVLRKMRHFQDAGHRVVFVVGDFTGMIGDPSGKKSTRPQLTRAEVEANAKTYTTQAFRSSTRRRPRSSSTAAGSRRSAPKASSASRRRSRSRGSSSATTFQKRWTARQPIALHELFYPLAQGYDSVALKADVELGGTDQLFNLLLGRDLMREEGLEPQVVMTLPLLVGLDGIEKMSKSLGNAIGIQEPPAEIYGKLMSIPDRLIWSYFELLTDVPAGEIRGGAAASSRERTNPRDAKADLARVVTGQFHGEEAAARAEEDFRRAFSRGELPEEIESTELAGRGDTPPRASSSPRDSRPRCARPGARSPKGRSRFTKPESRVSSGTRTSASTRHGTRLLRLGRRFRRIIWRT